MNELSSNLLLIIKHAQIASKLSKRMNSFLSPHGISFAEYLVMYFLQSSPLSALPRIALAEQLGMSASGITRLIAPMEKTGLVEKESNARDARQSLVKLSEVGKRLYTEATVTAHHAASYLSEGLSPAQIGKIIELYAKL